MAVGIGIELSSTAVRLALLERTSAKGSKRPVKVLLLREIPIESGNPNALTQALTRLKRAHAVNQPVVLGLPGTSVILSTVSPLLVDLARSKVAIQFELQQQLPFDVAESVWHSQWLSPHLATRKLKSPTKPKIKRPPKGKIGSMIPAPNPPLLDVLPQYPAVVAAMRNNVLEERLASVRRAGISVRAVTSSPIAILNSWAASQSNSGKGVTILNVSHDTAEWIVFTPSQVQVVPMIISLNTAEKANPQKTSELLDELEASWQALKSQFNDLAQEEILIAGVSSGSSWLQEEFSKRIGISVRRFDVENVVGPGTSGGLSDGIVPVGLGLQALDIARFPINLLSNLQEEASSKKVKNISMAVSGVGLLTILGLGVASISQTHQRQTQILKSLEGRERLYQSLRSEVRSMLKEQEKVKQKTNQLSKLVEERLALPRLLAEVASVLPDTIWLTKVESRKSDALEGILEGRARSFQDVTQFMDKLKNLAQISEVKPISTNVVTDAESGKEIVTFSIELKGQVESAAENIDAKDEEEVVKPAPRRRRRRR